MKTIRVGLLLSLSIAFLQLQAANAQNRMYSHEITPGIIGNQKSDGVAVGQDFRVRQPITISQLGMFDSGTNGIQANAVITIQLYERSADSGMLLETVTFDAANPGVLVNGGRFKSLPVPVTLLPGSYSVVAYGFNRKNPFATANQPPFATRPAWTLHDGGGRIVFESGARTSKADPGSFPTNMEAGPVGAYAAAVFSFAPTNLPVPAYAADYAALTAGVESFPLEDERHLGSLLVWSDCAFPILVEPGGSRQILAAASTCPTNGARVVAFAHTQWGRTTGDNRMVLFENAIRWASRKSEPSEITIGLGPRLSTNYFVARGYHVIPFDPWMTSSTNVFPECDVVVADWDIDYNSRVLNRIGIHVSRGGGVVLTSTPRFLTYRHMRSTFNRLNSLLEQFGIAYRTALTVPADLGFTNIQSIPYPSCFSAIPAAELLRQDRIGRIQLDSLSRAIAFHTINYTAMGQPQLLSLLTQIYSGGGGSGVQDSSNGPTSFVDVQTLTGAQAAQRTGKWVLNGADLVAEGRRGRVEYDLSVPSADVYRIQIEGAEAIPQSAASGFPLAFAIDGEELGTQRLQSAAGETGSVECWTPYLLPGTHRLTIFWDNAKSYTSLRIKAVRLQSGLGPDSDDNGIKDWVDQRVHSQSGLDITNRIISSYTSPACLEGRDAYPGFTRMNLDGADNKTYSLTPESTSDGRWYVNVPLSAYAEAEPLFQASFQNGALTESRSLHWTEINLLAASNSITIRTGDSLLFNAMPTEDSFGPIEVRVGERRFVGRSSQPLECNFPESGVFKVTGSYDLGAGSRRLTGSMTVKVVDAPGAKPPACWAGMERTWDLSNVSPEVSLAADSQLFCIPAANLPNQGLRFNLLCDDNEPRSIIARLGANGPVLTSTRTRSFQFSSGAQTYLTVVHEYPDGSQLVEMLVVCSPVLPDVWFQIDTIVAGVVFEDGTTQKRITADDFDPLGQLIVRFIRPAAARTSVCHSIKAFEKNTLIGYRR